MIISMILFVVICFLVLDDRVHILESNYFWKTLVGFSVFYIIFVVCEYKINSNQI